MVGDVAELLDLAAPNGAVAATVERAEALQGIFHLNFHWNTTSAGIGFTALGGGAAFVCTDSHAHRLAYTGTRQATPDLLDDGWYRWRDTTHNGLMFLIVVLPVGYAVRNKQDCQPEPKAYKVWNNRLALYWELDNTQTEAKWRMPKAGRSNLVNLAKKLNSPGVQSETPATPAVVDQNPPSGVRNLGFNVHSSLLQTGVKAVPELKFAVAAVGLFAAVGIIWMMGFSLQLALLAGLGMLVLMVGLLVFQKTVHAPHHEFVWPVRLLLGVSIGAIVLAIVFVFTSIFFHWPTDLRSWFIPPAPAPTAPGQSDVGKPQLENIDIADVSFLPYEDDCKAPRLDVKVTNNGVRSAFIKRVALNVKRCWRLNPLPGSTGVVYVETYRYFLTINPKVGPYTTDTSQGVKRDEFDRFTIQVKEEPWEKANTIYYGNVEIVANGDDAKFTSKDLLFYITQGSFRFPDAGGVREMIQIQKSFQDPLTLDDLHKALQANATMILEAASLGGMMNPAMRALVESTKQSDFEKVFTH